MKSTTEKCTKIQKNDLILWTFTRFPLYPSKIDLVYFGKDIIIIIIMILTC